MSLDRKESNYKKWVEVWRKEEREVKETAKKKPHILEKAKNRADLERRGIYRKNGFFYLKVTEAEKARRALYELPRSATAKAGTYVFVYQRKKLGRGYYNYLSGSYPYANEAHHLLPVKAFGKKHYKPNQLKVLKKIPYCVNHGQNVIFLPEKVKDCVVHNLPQHNGSHPPYNAAVAADASTTAAKMVEKAKDPCEPDDPIQLSALKELIGFQSDYWKLLIAAGAGVTVRQVGDQRLLAQATPTVPKASL